MTPDEKWQAWLVYAAAFAGAPLPDLVVGSTAYARQHVAAGMVVGVDDRLHADRRSRAALWEEVAQMLGEAAEAVPVEIGREERLAYERGAQEVIARFEAWHRDAGDMDCGDSAALTAKIKRELAREGAV